jgi:hypothetical protein
LNNSSNFVLFLAEGEVSCPPAAKRTHLDYDDQLSVPLNLSAAGHQLVPTGISLTYPVTTHQGTTYCTLEQVRISLTYPVTTHLGIAYCTLEKVRICLTKAHDNT